MDCVWISESPNLGKTESERLVGQSRKLRKQNEFDTPLSRENFLHWDSGEGEGWDPMGGVSSCLISSLLRGMGL